MSRWLDTSNNANRIRQSYVNGFLDISGGGIYLRNDLSINFYDTTNSTRPKFSINSSGMHIPDDFGFYQIVNPAKLLYIKDLTQNVEDSLNNFSTATQYISGSGSNINTMLEFNNANNSIVTHSHIVPSEAYTYDLGTPTLPFGSLYVRQGTIHFVDETGDKLAASISYNTSDGTLDLSAGGIKVPINNTTYSNGVLSTPVLSKNGNVGIGTTSPSSALDISGSVNVSGNTTMSGSLNINNGDVIMDGNLIIGSAIYEAGVPLSNKYLTTASPTMTGTTNMTSALVSKVLTVLGDLSLNGRMFVGGDVSMNGNLLVLKNLFVTTPTTSDNSTLAATTAFVKNQNYVGAVSSNLTGNTSIQNANVSQKFSVGGDVSLNSKLYAFGATTLNNTLFVNGITTLNNKLISLSDTSLNGNLNVAGNATVVTASNSDNSTRVATTAFVKNQGYAQLSGAVFTGDVSLSSRLFVSNDAVLTNRLIVSGDVSLNGNVNVITQLTSDNSNKVATTQFVKDQGYATIDSPSFIGNVTMQNTSINQGLNVTGDSAFIGNLNVNGNMVAITQFNSDNSTKVATTQFVKNQGYATIASPTFTGTVTATTLNVSNKITTTGDVSLNGNLFVSGDLSLNGNLTTVTQSTGDNSTKVATTRFVKGQGYAQLTGAAFTGDISLNTRLSVGGDVSLNSNISILGNTNLLGNAYAVTQLNADRTSRVATTAYVQNQGYSTVDSPQFTGIPTAPTPDYGTNSTQIATTEFVVSQLFSFINSNQDVYNSLQQLSQALSNTDASFATSLATSVGLKADKVSPIFSGTATMPTLNILQNLFSLGDVSFNKGLFVNGDASINGILSLLTPDYIDNSSKAATTAYVQNQGYAKITGADFTGDVNTTNNVNITKNLTVVKDASFNGNLVIDGAAILKGITQILNDLTLNGNLTHVGNSNITGNLNVTGALTSVTQSSADSTTKVATTAYVQNQGYAKLAGSVFTGDVSLNKQLYVANDAVLAAKMSVTGDVSLNNNLRVANDTVLNANVAVGGDASMNSRLYVASDIYEKGSSLRTIYATLESPTFTGVVNGITKSMIGLNNADNTADIYKPVSTAQQTALNLKANIANPEFTGTASIPNVNVSQFLAVVGDSSLNGKLFVDGDASMNGNVSVRGTITSLTPSTIDNSNKVATTAYVQNQGFISSTGGNFTGAVSFNNNLSIGGDLSLNGRLYTGGDASFSSNVYVDGKTTMNKDVYVNSNVYIANNISASGSVHIIGDISLNGNMNMNGTITTTTQLSSDNSSKVATTAYVQNQGYAKLSGSTFTGDVSMNSRLYVANDSLFNNQIAVTGDVSMSNRVFIGKDVSMNAKLSVSGKSQFADDVAINKQLAVTSDVSLNAKLFVAGDVSLNGNLNIDGIFNVVTPLTGDNSTRVATTSFVKNQNYAPISSPSFIGTATMTTAVIDQNLIVNSDAYLQNNLIVTTDATVGGNLTTTLDANIGGNLNVSGSMSTATPVTSDNSTKVATTAFVKSQPFASLVSPTFTGTLAAYRVDISQNLVVLGDTSLNGNLNVNGTMSTTTPVTEDNSTRIATTAFVKSQPFAPLVSPTFTGVINAVSENLSGSLYVGGDVSMNGNLIVSKTLYENGTPLSSTYAPLISPTFTGTVGGITKYMVDLSNVDNTSDINKPVSTAQQTALNLKANIASPTFTGVVNAVSENLSGNLYVGGDVSMNGNLIVSKTLYENGTPLSSTYATLASPNFTGTVRGITKYMVDLSNVDNTSDVNKPVSTAQQTALNLKANLANPTFSGTVNAPSIDISQNLAVRGDASMNGNITVGGTIYTLTPNTSDNSTRVATTSFVKNQAFASLTGGNFTGDVSMNGNLLVLGNVTMNGITTATTPIPSDNSRRVATTAFVQNIGFATLNSPAFTGAPTAPTLETAAPTTTQIATTKYVENKITDFFNTASTSTINAINQLSAALSNTDASFTTTLATQLAIKADIAAPTFTGIVSMPTANISQNAAIGGDLSLNGSLRTGGIVYEDGVALVNKYATLSSPAFTGTVSGITKSMVGLTNVDNTADIYKPVSTAQQTALNSKANVNSPTFTGTVTTVSENISDNLYVGGDVSMNANLIVAKTVYENGLPLASTYATLASPTFTGTVGGITKYMVDLSNVDNTSDVNKPVSTAQQTALNLKANVASPSFTGSATVAQALIVGGDISLNGNLIVAKTVYENGLSLASTYATLASPTFTGTVGGITKYMVDLSNVDNTSDVNKPVSAAQQTALNLKANIASPAFTGSASVAQALFVGGDLSVNGNITTVTQLTSDNSTRVATTAFVKNQNAGYAQLTGAVFSGDISLNTRLFVGGDVSLNGKLFVGGDLSVNGIITGRYSSNSIPLAAIIGGLGTNVDLSSNQTISGVKTFVNDVSINSRIFVAGSIVAAGNNIVSNLYQPAVHASSTTISNLLKLTNNANGTFVNQLEISKLNGLTIAYNSTNGAPVLSNNGGQNWTTMSLTSGNNSYGGMLCMSPDGRIRMKQEYGTTANLYVSTDWGITYNAVSLAQSFIYTNAFYGYNTYNDQAYAFSNDGSTLYFIARDTNNTVVVWKNTDASFNSFTRQNLSWNYSLSNSPRSIATSGNGQYVLLITGIIPANGMFLFISSNYGASYTKTANSLNTTWNSIAVSNSGKYQAATNNNNIYQSSDYGVTWSPSSVAPTAKWNFISMSNDSKYRVACIDSSYQYISMDYGSSWNVIPNSLGNWKKSVLVDASNNNNIAIYSHDGVNVYKNYYNYTDVLQKTTIASDLVINTPYHYLNNIGKVMKTVKTNYFTPTDMGRFPALSSDGKYMVLPISGKQTLMSQDYGSTWLPLTGLTAQLDYKYSAVSGNGQYMFVRKGSTTYLSTNYGVSWGLFTRVSSTDNVGGIAMSFNGQYMVYAGLDTNSVSNVYLSSNYGATWTSVATFATSSTGYSAAMSDNGQYISVLSTNSYLMVSSNYGTTWTIAYQNAMTNCNQVVVSSTGQYQTVVSSTSIFTSTNYGANFTLTYSGATSPGFTAVTMINSGENQYAVNSNDNKLYKSVDYGASWYPIYTNSSAPNNTVISRDGSAMIYGASGDIYISRAADNAGSINSSALSISSKGIVSSLDLSVNGTISLQNLVVDRIFENGNLLASKYATIASPAFTGTVTGITNAMVGLGNVNNTSDINKPISTSTQSALDSKANIASPVFTGTLTSSKIDISQNLTVIGDSSFNSRLFVAGDVSMNGMLYANYAENTIPITAIRGGIPSANGVFSSDISANYRVFVGGDVSFNSKLFVSNDVWLNSKLLLFGDASMNANLTVGGKGTFNSVLTKTDMQIGNRLFVGGDASMSGNLYVSQTLFENGTPLNAVYAPIESPTLNGTVTMSRAVINDLFTVNAADSYLTGNAIVTGNMTANTNLYVNNSIYENGVALINKYATLNSPIFTGTVSGITSTMVGLSNVDNTSDLNKPISTAAQTALNSKSPLASPGFTGVPTAPTASTGNNTSQIATTAYVRSEIYNLVGSAPTTLNTLQELAEAINSDASFAHTITSQIALKSPINNPTFTGTVITPNAVINQNLNVIGDTSLNGNLFLNGQLTYNNDFTINKNLYLGGDLSVNGNIRGTYQANSIPSTAISNIRNQYGELTIQTQRADIVEFDDEFFETSYSSGVGAYVETLYSYNSDLSLNGNLYINGDGATFSNVSVNKVLDLNGSLIAHNNVNVYGIINQGVSDGQIANYSNDDRLIAMQNQIDTLQQQLSQVLLLLANNNIN